MKRIICFVLSAILLFALTACGNSPDGQVTGSVISSDITEDIVESPLEETQDAPEPPQISEKEAVSSMPIDSSVQESSSSTTDTLPPQQAIPNTSEENTVTKMNIQVGNSTFTATLADNSSADSLVEMMKKAPIVIQMSDYGGFEKVGPIGTNLPTNDEQISTDMGDIILYQGNNIVIYYAPNSWNFTRLGKIDDTTGLRDALGSGDVEVTFKLQNETYEVNENMKISVKGNGNTIAFVLNDSPASKELYAQLPLTIEVENFSTNEKVFYPPKKLTTTDTPLADAKKGTLCYYAPWGDVVMFYEDFGKGSSLYELGQVVSGKDDIEKLSGTIEITAAE